MLVVRPRGCIRPKMNPNPTIRMALKTPNYNLCAQVVQWTRYVEEEISAGNINAAKGIFGRCLLACPNIDLFTQYLRCAGGLDANSPALLWCC